MSAESKAQFEQQIVGSLTRLDPARSFVAAPAGNAALARTQMPASPPAPEAPLLTTCVLTQGPALWAAALTVNFSPVEDKLAGEILDAQVGIPESWSRGDRTFITEQAPSAWPAFDADATWRGRRGLGFGPRGCRHFGVRLATLAGAAGTWRAGSGTE